MRCIYLLAALKHYNVGPGARVAILGPGASRTRGRADRQGRQAQTCPSSLMDVPETDARAGADHFYATSEGDYSNRCTVPSASPVHQCLPTALGCARMAALRPYGVLRCGPAHQSPSLPLRSP